MGEEIKKYPYLTPSDSIPANIQTNYPSCNAFTAILSSPSQRVCCIFNSIYYYKTCIISGERVALDHHISNTRKILWSNVDHARQTVKLHYSIISLSPTNAGKSVKPRSVKPTQSLLCCSIDMLATKNNNGYTKKTQNNFLLNNNNNVKGMRKNLEPMQREIVPWEWTCQWSESLASI